MLQLPSGGNIAAALKTDRTVQLIRGGTYSATNLSLPSGSTLSWYGDTSKPKPKINGNISFDSKADVTINGVSLVGSGKAGVYGLRAFRSKNVAITNNDITGYGGNGLTVEGFGGVRCSNVTLRGNLIANNFPPDTAHHCEGTFVSYTDGLVLDGNVFDTNGGSPGVETNKNHNAYIHGSCGPATVTNNVFANGSSHGLQQRSGGVCEGNVFLDNPIHLSYGLVNGELCFAGGVTGSIRKNLFIGGGAIGTQQMGWGIQLGNLKLVTIENNIFAHDQKATGAALRFEKGDGVTNAAQELPAAKWKVSVSGLWVYDRANAIYTYEAEIRTTCKPTFGVNVGKVPPQQPDMRGPAVLGSGFMPWARSNPIAAAPAALTKAWKACGLV